MSFTLASQKLKHIGITLTEICTKPAAATAKSLQSCPTLCDPIDGSPPGSPVPRTLQARTLERVAISFSNVQGLYKDKYKNQITEIKKLERYVMIMDRRLNIVWMSVLPSFIFKFTVISKKQTNKQKKNLENYFVNIDKLILKFTWRGKRPRIANSILRRKTE